MALLPVAIGAGVALMLVFAHAGLRALWLWPALGVLAYPLANHLPGGKYVSFDRIWIGGMVALLFSQPEVRGHVRASRRLFAALALLTVVLGVRAIGTPAASLLPVRVWFDSLVLPLILFALVRRAVATDPRVTEQVAFSVMVAGALLAVIGIAEHFLGFELASLSGSQVRFDPSIGLVRISGPYDAPETYGLTLIVCLAATMYWLLSRRRKQEARLAGLAIVSLEVLAIFFTYFRVGWGSALLVVVAALGLRPRRYGRATVTAVVAALVVVPVFVQLEAAPAVSQRVQNTDNIYTRLATYRQGWEIFKMAPVAGVGAQQYTAVANTLPIAYSHGSGSQPYPHSSFFEVLSEDGIVGFVPFMIALLAILGLIRALNRAARTETDGVLAAVVIGASVSYLIYSLSLTMLPYSASNEMFAIVLGMAAGRLDSLGGCRVGSRLETAG